MGPVPLSAFEVYQQLDQGKRKRKGKKALAVGFQQVAQEVQRLKSNDSKSGPSQVSEKASFVIVPKPSEKDGKKKLSKKPAHEVVAFNGHLANGSDVKLANGERSKLNSSGLESKRKVKRLKKRKEAKRVPVSPGSKTFSSDEDDVDIAESESPQATGSGKKHSEKVKPEEPSAAKKHSNKASSEEPSPVKKQPKKAKLEEPSQAKKHPNKASSEEPSPVKKQPKKAKLEEPSQAKKHPNKSSPEEPSPVKKPSKKAKSGDPSPAGSSGSGNVDTLRDSRIEGKKVLAWIVTPISLTDFYDKYWEARPLYITRPSHRHYFRHVLTSEQIDKGLREQRLFFTKNIDVTSYVNGVKEIHNPTGRAFAPVVWDFYRNGCSVRILNPQTYFPDVRKLCTDLQDCFNNFVGANVYLTPPNSQGFAPHYDDIEAFVLQLEGKKKWKVYSPRKGEKLPRTSSRNFTEQEMEKPVLEVELQPGDMLYMPRGFIHQASTVPGVHSLHITVSTYQHSSWADLMEKLVPAALANAIAEDDEFREGVPWDFLQQMGAVYSTDERLQRRIITEKIKRMFAKLFKHAPIDAAADQLARDCLHESLPPMLSPEERRLCVHGDGDTLKDGEVSPHRQLSLECSVRLVRHGVLRLVSEDKPDTVSLYYCAQNPLVYKEEEEQLLEMAVELAPAVEALIRNYPAYTLVSDLPLDDEEMKFQVAVELWERGLIMTNERIPSSEPTVIED